MTGTPDPPPRARHGATWSWLAVGVVFAIVATLVLVKVVGSGDAQRAAVDRVPTPTQLLDEVTSIPASVYDEVGIDSPEVPITAPTVLTGRPALTARTRAGAHVPVVLYVGAEFSPFCAAERWALVAALSRFGTFSALDEMQSSAVDFAPDTQSFTFDGVRYRSRWIDFQAFEVASDVQGANGGYGALMKVPSRYRAVERADDPSAIYPFVDIDNDVEVIDVTFSPEVLATLTRDQIAGALSDPAYPVTQAIVSAANYLTAGICATDGAQPLAVCTSSGVGDAASAMRLSIVSSPGAR